MLKTGKGRDLLHDQDRKMERWETSGRPGGDQSNSTTGRRLKQKVQNETEVCPISINEYAQWLAAGRRWWRLFCGLQLSYHHSAQSRQAAWLAKRRHEIRTPAQQCANRCLKADSTDVQLDSAGQNCANGKRLNQPRLFLTLLLLT